MRTGTKRILSIFFTWAFIFATRLSVQSKVPHSRINDYSGVQSSSAPLQSKYNHISYPSEYEQQILYALSYYPDLLEVKIEFVEKNIATTLNCKPKVTSLLLGKERRVYVIGINKKKRFKGIHFHEIPLEGQIGIIGHELAHIKDYHSRGVLGVIKRGIDYLHYKSKAKFEKSIDLMTVQAGLGHYLHRWAHYALNESDATEKYKAFKRKIYLDPEEIQALNK